MGLPFNRPVAKQNLTIVSGGIPYTWQDAVNNTIVLPSVYGWDALAQSYALTSVLAPGQGFWMYAYNNCIVKKGT
jgi:hypothetical protein